MEGGDSKFAKFTVPTLMAFLKARSQNVSGNKQQLVARAGMPKNAFVPRTRDLLVRKTDTFFSHPPSPFPGNFCNCNSGGICTASQFLVELPLSYTA